MVLFWGVFVVVVKWMFFGVYGGFLKDFIVIDLFEFVVKVVLFVGKVLFEIVDSVIMGNVL